MYRIYGSRFRVTGLGLVAQGLRLKKKPGGSGRVLCM
jgi:hypothetical protein